LPIADYHSFLYQQGCPKKFSVSGGMGSALLSDLPRACDIIKTLRANVNIPVSAKIRLLKDDVSTVDFIRSLIKAGANAVTIHAREVGDESQQPAKWDRLVNVVQAVKVVESVPVIINGDLYTRNDMITMKERTGADGVMLARPALYNVSLFKKPTVPADGDVAAASNVIAPYGYNSPLLESKTDVVQSYLAHCLKYAPNAKNVKYVVCEMMNNRRNPSHLVPNLPMMFPGGQSIKSVSNCHSLEEICKVWDVSTSGAITGATGQGSATEQHYDDRYFLDPEALKRERDAIKQDATAKKTIVAVEGGETAMNEEDIAAAAGATKRQRVE
jgi:tRNA-dihydrouridine synthase